MTRMKSQRSPRWLISTRPPIKCIFLLILLYSSESITPTKAIPKTLEESDINISNEYIEPIDARVSSTKKSPNNHLKGAPPSTTQKKNQTTMLDTPTNSNTQENISNSPMHNIPIHEPKMIQQKPEKKNDMLDYSISSTARVINKIPKGRYGYIEEYDLIKAEKFLSKRKIDVKYDNDTVYGMPSSTASSVKGKKSISDESKSVSEKKEEKEDRMIHGPYDIVRESPEIEEESPKLHPRVLKSETKNKKKIIREKEDSITKLKKDTNVIKEEGRTFKKLKDENKPHNKNFDLLFNDKTTEEKETNNDKVKSNKNFLLLDTVPEPSIQEHLPNQNDIFSCSNCEPIYRLSILNNIPLKVLKCLVCGNVINNTSLLFYLEKYKEELLKKKPRAADEKGICNEWGNWVDIKAKTVKEDNKYKNNREQYSKREEIFNNGKSKSKTGNSNTKTSSEETYELEGTLKRRAKLEDFKRKLEDDVKKTDI